MNASSKASVRAYLQPRVLVMLVLGFSSGLPFLLVGNTFGYWLRDKGTTLTAIGFISWVGIAYSLKFLWAPLIDRLNAPLLGGLGRRRGWMALAQIIVGVSLIAMALVGTNAGLGLLGALALVVAFASSTQDIVIDAWRIESAQSGEELGLLSSAYQFGYRIALLATDALILIVADHLGWPVSYAAYGVLMGIGLLATLLAAEPLRADAVIEDKSERLPLWSANGLFDAIIGPFFVFFRTYGWLALLMLAAISLYRLPDFVMGPMANPLYHDIGLSKDWVGTIRGSIGLFASFAGIAAGGFWALRFGYMSALIVGGILQALAVAGFASLPVFASHMSLPPLFTTASGDLLHVIFVNPNLRLFAAVMVGDNFGTSFAGVALVSYMSSLTSLGYTATQYALLSSTYAWAGKILKGFSGVTVESLTASHGLMGAYAIFFVGAGLIGLPAVLLFALLAARHRAMRRAGSLLPMQPS
jgi:PAT family beta-lactamase induction signal transducer AmpG